MLAWRVRRLVPIATQAFLLGSAMVMAFGFPILFGIGNFGLFVQATALTFIAHRIVDLISESALVAKDLGHLVKIALTAACLLALAGLPAALIPQIPRGYQLAYPLFGSLVATTIVLNALFQTGSAALQLAYAVLFFALMIAGAAVLYISGSGDLALMLTGVNCCGAIAGGALLWAYRKRLPHGHAAEGVRRDTALLARLGIISFNVLLTYGVVVLQSDRFDAEQLGQLRIFSSLALLGATLSPINPKAYYALLEGVDSASALAARLRPVRWPIGAALAAWAAGLVLAATFFNRPHIAVYLLGAALYPATAYISIQDKLLLRASGVRAFGTVVGSYSVMAIVMLRLVENAWFFVLMLAALVCAYPLVASLALKPGLAKAALLPVAMSVLAAGAVALIAAGWPGGGF